MSKRQVICHTHRVTTVIPKPSDCLICSMEQQLAQVQQERDAERDGLSHWTAPDGTAYNLLDDAEVLRLVSDVTKIANLEQLYNDARVEAAEEAGARDQADKEIARLREQLEQAKAEERERCAKIADEWITHYPTDIWVPPTKETARAAGALLARIGLFIDTFSAESSRHSARCIAAAIRKEGAGG